MAGSATFDGGPSGDGPPGAASVRSLWRSAARAYLGRRRRGRRRPYHGLMARRADPERIYEARRAATIRRLVDADHLDEIDADHRIAAWERHAESEGIERLTAAFWLDEIGDAGRDPRLVDHVVADLVERWCAV